MKINDCSFKNVCVVCCLKIRFYCLTFPAILTLNSADFTTSTSHQRVLILKIELQDMSSRHLQDMSSRRLQEVFSVTIFCLPRRLEGRKIVTLKTCWRRLQDQQMFAGECLTLYSALHTDDLLVDLILRVLTFCQGSR